MISLYYLVYYVFSIFLEVVLYIVIKCDCDKCIIFYMFKVCK